jgi:sugar O-acyltransferase (sialic acid O-acetyltransferase NeuD family)
MKVIYCAGEQGRVVVDILQAAGSTENLIFIDDDSARHGEQVAGVDVVGGLEELERVSTEDIRCTVAFGDRPGVRLRLADRLADRGYAFFSTIHPSTQISEAAALGEGIIINAQSYIGPNVRIGDHVLIDSCNNISHDVTVEDGCTITPNATLAGGVVVEQDAYIGPSATVIEDTTIGSGAIVGAGTVVTEDVPPETTVVGVPASPVEE